MPATDTPLYKEGEDPKKDVLPTDQQLNIRLSIKDIDLIDEEIERMEKETPGLKLSRSEMGRILVRKGLNKK